jgi:DNA-binding XRE family transcriptional regulator
LSASNDDKAEAELARQFGWWWNDLIVPTGQPDAKPEEETKRQNSRIRSEDRQGFWYELEARQKYDAYKKPKYRLGLSFNQLFGQNVHRLRVGMNLTQEKFSEAINVSRTYLQSIEGGRSNPTLQVAEQIVKACRCSWDELMVGTDRPAGENR